jgi:putative transposase
MPRGLRRFQESRQSHFVTFSCRHRQAYFSNARLFDLFVQCLEDMRRRFELRVYGYVVMPEHVHLLLSEPIRGKLADALHYLKLSFAKRVRGMRFEGPQVSAQTTGANLGHNPYPQQDSDCDRSSSGSFWEKRYHDRNVRDYDEFIVKLRYLHRNPVKRGLVCAPEEWKWSSYRHYALREIGVVEIESEWTARDREACGDARVFLRPS